jgi:MFS family permease
MLTQYAFAAHFVMFATYALGLSVSRAGAVLGISFVTAVMGRVLWSIISDYLFKARRKMVVTLIGAVGAAVSVGFALLITYRSTAWLYLFAVVFGLTGLSWNAIYLTRVGEFPGKALAGIATGLNFVLINIGAVSGPPLYGYLVDISHGYTIPWIVIGFCMLLVGFLSKIQKKERLVME